MDVFQVPPGCRRSSVSPEDADHPLISGRAIYSLPMTLWDVVIREVGKPRFDSKLLELELRLSEICGDHSFQVGFQDGQPVLFQRLRGRPLSFPQPMWNGWKTKTGAEWESCLKLMEERLDYFVQIIRGYLGWLLTNPVFLQEHDSLWENCDRDVAQHGIPKCIEGGFAQGELPAGWQRIASRSSNAATRFEEFCRRWRLSQMAGPYLPQPEEPRVPDPTSHNAVPLFRIPSIMGIDGSGRVRQMIDDSLHDGDEAGHLLEWFEIVRSDNSGKKSIKRFGRVFELQHFARALTERHEAALHHRREYLREAFAAFFGVSSDAIRDDYRLIKRRFSSCGNQPSWLNAI